MTGAILGLVFSLGFSSPLYISLPPHAVFFVIEHSSSPSELASAGSAAEKLEFYRRAESLYKKSAMLSPEKAKYALILARFYSSLERPDRALPVLQNAVTTAENTMSLNIQIGKTLITLGRHDEAIKSLKTLLKQNLTKACRAKAYTLIGNAYVALGDYSLAGEAYNTALEINPTAATLLAVAKMKLELRDYKGALSDLQRAKFLNGRGFLSPYISLQLQKACYYIAKSLDDEGEHVKANLYRKKLLAESKSNHSIYAEKALYFSRHSIK